MTDSLIIKYRPQKWEEVVGQEEIVRALRARVHARDTHSTLLIGESGCGKTTLARIAAMELGAVPATLVEVDAATFTGIDAMRKLTEMLRYVPIGGETLVFIIDEAHRLSSNAWDSLLKAIEEPPDWAYWFFCTTDAGKVPQTIVTRSLRLTVARLSWQVLLEQLLLPIADAEKIEVLDEVLGVCSRAANGSPRQALNNLAVCAEARDAKEASRLLQEAEEADEEAPVKLARLLVNGGKWVDHYLPLLNQIKDNDTNPESVRHIVREYATKAALGATQEQKAQRLCAILDNFSVPFSRYDGITPLLLACARTVLLR